MDVAPREIDEAFADLALHCWTTEVERPVPFHDLDVRLPDRLASVGSYELCRLAADLDAYVNLVHRGAVRAAERTARKVRPDDRYSHATDTALAQTSGTTAVLLINFRCDSR